MPPRSRPRPRRLLIGLAAPILTLSACTGETPGTTDAPTTAAPTSSTPASGEPGTTTTSAAPTTRSPAPVETGPARALLEGLAVAWSIALLPDGSALVGERDTGDLHHVPAPESGDQPRVVGRLPIERTSGEGGLLGLAVPEDFEVNPVL